MVEIINAYYSDMIICFDCNDVLSAKNYYIEQ